MSNGEKLFSRRELLKGSLILSSAGLFLTVFNCGLFLTGCGSKDTVIVKTRKELEKAVENKVKTIIVKGELANNVKKSYDIKTASKAAIASLGTLLVGAGKTAQVTGGMNSEMTSGISEVTGLETELITAVATLGLSLALAVSNEYDIIKSEAGKDDAYIELRKAKNG